MLILPYSYFYVVLYCHEIDRMYVSVPGSGCMDSMALLREPRRSHGINAKAIKSTHESSVCSLISLLDCFHFLPQQGLVSRAATTGRRY